jgi:tetratricopeptide (TPR) repeat protein
MRDRVFLIGAILLLGAVGGYLVHRHFAAEQALRDEEAATLQRAATGCLAGYYEMTRGAARARNEACTRALAADKLPPDKAAHLHGARAVARLAAGDTTGAASDAQVALTHYDKEAAAGTPAPESLARRAVALHLAGDAKGALAAYDAAIKAAPNDPTLLYRRGVLRTVPLGDYSGAIEDFDAALAQSPNNIDVLIRRGDAYGRAGDAQKSIADLDRAVWLNLESAPAHLYRGMERARLGQYAGALEDFATALALDPSDANALINRAAVYLAERNPGQALTDLDRAVALEPASALAFYNRGYAQFLLRRFDDAAKSYAQAIALDPQFALAYENRCLVETILARDLAAARADCDKALALRPKVASVHQTRGFLFLKLADPKQAVTEYDEVLEQDPNNALALFGRGLARVRLGDATAGENDKNAAVTIDPEVAAQFATYGVD